MKIFLNGCNGKMGRAIRECAENGVTGPSVTFTRLRDAGFDEISDPSFDIIIDFSSQAGAENAYKEALKAGKPFLCGTTALSQTLIDNFKNEKSIPLFFSPNVSLGVFLFSKLLLAAARMTSGEFTPSLHEIHHTAKKDAPSGTAKMLAAMLENNGIKIPVTFDRIENTVGTHILNLDSAAGDETISITHKAKDRKLFARSALKVASWLVHQRPGFYDMEKYSGGMDSAG